MGNIRLLPMVAVAALCLLALKGVSLYLTGGAIFSGSREVAAKRLDFRGTVSMEGATVSNQATSNIVTGAAGEKKVAQNTEDDANLKAGPNFKAARSEYAILQSLANRRRKLDEREKQLILQRNLLKAAEKRLETKIAEMKSIEEKAGKAKKKNISSQSKRYRKLVEMYSKMKPADAAKIFNRLDVSVLVELVEHMNSRAMGAILSLMDPVKAEQLTIEIASQGKTATKSIKSLPKINNK